MDFITAIKTVFSKYVVFTGRARRSEFWYWQLFAIILNIATCWMPGVNWLISIAIMLPTIAVCIRRLHDTGRSGWWLMLSIVPGIITYILLFAILGSALILLMNSGGTVSDDIVIEAFAASIGLTLSYCLFALLSLVGLIILIVWWATDSQPGENQYGANPKENNPNVQVPDIPEVPKA